jgi:hypothetical protein
LIQTTLPAAAAPGAGHSEPGRAKVLWWPSGCQEAAPGWRGLPANDGFFNREGGPEGEPGHRQATATSEAHLPSLEKRGGRGGAHRCEGALLCPFLARLARRVLEVSATSASPDRLFSAAGNEMTKKRTRLTCENLETVVYLHEMWPQTREWEARKHFKAV